MLTGDTAYYSGGPEFEIRLGFQFLLLKFFIVCPSLLPVNDSCTIKQTTSALFQLKTQNYTFTFHELVSLALVQKCSLPITERNEFSWLRYP
jgi:hypothetical protein